MTRHEQLLPSQPSINVNEHELDKATGPTGGDPRVTTPTSQPSIVYSAVGVTHTITNAKTRLAKLAVEK